MMCTETGRGIRNDSGIIVHGHRHAHVHVPKASACACVCACLGEEAGGIVVDRPLLLDEVERPILAVVEHL